MAPGAVVSRGTSEQIEAALDEARMIVLQVEGGFEVFCGNHPEMIGRAGIGTGGGELQAGFRLATKDGRA
jgi:hypothetical protein